MADEVTTPTANVAKEYNDNTKAGITNSYDQIKNNAVSAFENAYNSNVSAQNAATQKMSGMYDQKVDSLNNEYQRQMLNNNRKAVYNGLNAQDGSQAALEGNMMMRSSAAKLNKAKQNMQSDMDFRMKNLQQQYQDDIAAAIAQNDYQKGAALLDEYSKAYERDSNRAKTLANWGDFSGYADIYGQDQADNMAKAWNMQNPDMAYTLGKITADEYYKQTGRWPNGYSTGSGGGGDWFSYSGTNDWIEAHPQYGYNYVYQTRYDKHTGETYDYYGGGDKWGQYK